MTASRPEPGVSRCLPGRGAQLARLGLLAAAAVAAYVFEGALPTPLPWARLGISNVVVVVVLFTQGLGAAFAINLVRIVAGNLLVGMLAGPAFIFSAAGSTAALLVMAGLRKTLVPPLSIVGTSVAGAAANNAVQVGVFAGLFAPTAPVANLLGVFLLLGLGVGLATGLAAAAIAPKVGLASRPGLG